MVAEDSICANKVVSQQYFDTLRINSKLMSANIFILVAVRCISSCIHGKISVAGALVLLMCNNWKD